MDQDNKNTTGAPSNDTTSALFVSARKKQLEQQEAERRALEKEEKRLAAEAEVRRLELEVAERRRKAEEDAKRADEDAKRIAEEARAKQAEAAANPDAVLGAQQPKKEVKLPTMPKLPTAGKPAAPTASAGGAATAAKAPLNTKLIAIIGGGVALAIIVVIVLVIALGGDESEEPFEGDNSIDSGEMAGELTSFYNDYISFEYPDNWGVTELPPDAHPSFDGAVIVEPSESNGTELLFMTDFTKGDSAVEELETPEELLIRFTEDIISTITLAETLGEPSEPTFDEPFNIGNDLMYVMDISFGDTPCRVTLIYTESGVVQGFLWAGTDGSYSYEFGQIAASLQGV